MTAALEVKDIHKRFGELEVLRGVDLTADPGDVIAVIGGSGSGKSTLLRCINLLEVPNEGSIRIDGEELALQRHRDGALHPVDRRQITRMRARLGFVFQNFNLWPHMSILRNVTEGPIHVLGLS
ncbi:MAG: ATP-binding cassette domain-containing protein, partial [Halofilum sp. (in: g-proteobacteria)]|nr:ATP-binding cassette domain-containing protein [Halofilum sp. (in: g-proteobacteria)]